MDGKKKTLVVIVAIICLTSIALIGILKDKEINITIHLGGSNNESTGIERWINPDAHIIPNYPEAESGDFKGEKLI